MSHRIAQAEQWASQALLADSVSAHLEMTYHISNDSHALGFLLMPFFFLPFTFLIVQKGISVKINLTQSIAKAGAPHPTWLSSVV